MEWKNIGIECIKTAIKEIRKIKEVKALNSEINIQTNADLVSNKTIINFLKDKKVGCNLFSEENKNMLKINGGNDRIVFVIDPIDNTHLYLRGELSFCSVALMILVNDFPRYSFVGDISNGDIYYCDDNFAYKNGQKIRVPSEIQGRNIILGWAPYKLRIERLFGNLSDLTKGNYYLYNFGGQLQTVKIATGNYDAYVEVRAETLNEFCGAAIVERAGGIVSTAKGKKIVYEPNKKQTLIIARNKKIHNDILNRLKDKDYEN